MSDFQDISTSVVVHGAPKVEKFTPMSGQNAGKEQTVLNFRAYHPNFQRQEDGSFKMLDSDWYDVKYNGKAWGVRVSSISILRVRQEGRMSQGHAGEKSKGGMTSSTTGRRSSRCKVCSKTA